MTDSNEQFSNKKIVDQLLPRTSEVLKRMLDKHVRISDQNYIKKLAYTYLEEAHQKAFQDSFIKPFKDLIKETYPKYLEALYEAFDKMEAPIEGEDQTRERDVRCKELSLWLARYIAENPAHGEDDGFLDIISREISGKFLGGLPRLDLELALSIVTGSLQEHMNIVFKEKFGKQQDEIDLDDLDEVLKAKNEKMKDIPSEK